MSAAAIELCSDFGQIWTQIVIFYSTLINCRIVSSTSDLVMDFLSV